MSGLQNLKQNFAYQAQSFQFADEYANEHNLQSPHFFKFTQTLDLTSLLSDHYQHYVEIGKQALLHGTMQRIINLRPDFSLCLSSRHAYSTPLFEIIPHVLNQRFGLKDRCLMSIMTCLQETIQNAVVHGNLGLLSQFEDAAELENYYELIQNILAQEPFCNRRITICTWHDDRFATISVSDQGQGFELPKTDSSNTSPHGRGLMLVQAMCHKLWMVPGDRRTVYMNFNLSDPI